jgi:hypothetical protein
LAPNFWETGLKKESSKRIINGSIGLGFGFAGQKLSRFLFMGQSQRVPKTA